MRTSCRKMELRRGARTWGGERGRAERAGACWVLCQGGELKPARVSGVGWDSRAVDCVHIAMRSQQPNPRTSTSTCPHTSPLRSRAPATHQPPTTHHQPPTVTTHCEPLVPGPALAMDRMPGRSCRSALWNSSSNSPPQMDSPPVPSPVGVVEQVEVVVVVVVEEAVSGATGKRRHTHLRLRRPDCHQLRPHTTPLDSVRCRINYPPPPPPHQPPNPARLPPRTHPAGLLSGS